MIDHVLVHGMTMRKAGQRVQPNLSRFYNQGIERTEQVISFLGGFFWLLKVLYTDVSVHDLASIKETRGKSPSVLYIHCMYIL